MSFRRLLVAVACLFALVGSLFGIAWWRAPHAEVVHVDKAELEDVRDSGSGSAPLAVKETRVEPSSLRAVRELWEEQELADARTALEAALELGASGDDEGVLHVLLSVVCRRQHDATAAVEHGRLGAELCPTSAAAHHVYARAITERMRDGMLVALRNAKPWRTELRTAIELDPANVDARTEELIFYAFVPGAMGGDRERAEELLVELEGLDPVRAASLRVRMLDNDEDTDGALALAGQALARHPGAPELLLTRGDLHAKAESYEEADADYRSAAELRPDEAAWRAVYQRAKLRLDLERDAAEALAFLDEYASGAPRGDYLPSPARLQIARARALARLDRAEEARAAYDAALEHDAKAGPKGAISEELEAAAPSAPE